jgi:hypothetical protein
VNGGKEIYFRLADLAHRGEVDLLNCDEARIDDTEAALFELERAVAERLARMHRAAPEEREPLWALMFDAKELKGTAPCHCAQNGRWAGVAAL